MHGRETPKSDLAKRHLSPARRQLLRQMQKILFGRFENLRVVDGEPVLKPPPRVVRTVKIVGRNMPRPQIESDDFALRREWVDFFNHLDAIRDGTIAVIEVAHGLPFSFEIEQVPSV